MIPLRERPSVAGEVPLVSIAMTAYNSAVTLPRALDSVLEQQTAFPVEIVLGDDCSPDNTADVARAYAARYPGVIRVLVREHNLGIMHNYHATFSDCRGRYIAWLDADDYWTDPEKLTLQTGLLEADASIALVGHTVRWVSATGEVRRERVPALAAGRYGLDQIVRSNFLPSPSVMFRNGIQNRLPAWYFDAAPMTDWPIYVLAAGDGDIVLLDRTMADYTLNATSSLWGKGEAFWYELDARFYDRMQTILPPAFHRLARSEKGKRYERLAYKARQDGDFAASRRAAFAAVRAPAWSDNFPGKYKALAAALFHEVRHRAARLTG